MPQSKSLTDCFHSHQLVKRKVPDDFFKNSTIKITLQGVANPNVDELIKELTRNDFITGGERPLVNLYLSSNRISDCTQIAESVYCRRDLQKLSLADNLIADPSNVTLLAANLPQLKHLVLSGNPIASTNPSLYSGKTITTFEGRLLTLDGENVSELRHLDRAIKTTKFEEHSIGQRILKMSFDVYSLDRAASALKIRNELLQFESKTNDGSFESSSTESDANSIDLEGDGDFDNGGVGAGSKSRRRQKKETTVKKLLKVWNTSPNTTGLDRTTVVKTLHARLNSIIRRTRENRHSHIKDWQKNLIANPLGAYDEICKDWDAAFASISLPLEDEIKSLERECSACTGELEEGEMNAAEYNLLEKTALSHLSDSEDQQCERRGNDDDDVVDVDRNSKTMTIGEQMKNLSKSNIGKDALAIFGKKAPPTPTGSITSNEKIPELSDKEYEKRMKHETYTQVLKLMERGKLNVNGGKNSSNFSMMSRNTVNISVNDTRDTWRPPPSLSSPTRRVQQQYNNHSSTLLDESKNVLIKDITDSVVHSSPVKAVRHHHHLNANDDDNSSLSSEDDEDDDLLLSALESINWDSVVPDDVVYFADRSPSKPDLSLPPPPSLSPPARIALPKPQMYTRLAFPGETMKLLYEQVDSCFEIMCDNHDTHLILFQVCAL